MFMRCRGNRRLGSAAEGQRHGARMPRRPPRRLLLLLSVLSFLLLLLVLLLLLSSLLLLLVVVSILLLSLSLVVLSHPRTSGPSSRFAEGPGETSDLCVYIYIYIFAGDRLGCILVADKWGPH